MQISTAQMFARGVDQMSEQKTKVTEMQAKLSTGKQIIKPSDDAEKAGTIQRIKTAAGRQDSYEKTLNTMNDRLATEDAALRSIDNVMQRVRVLAVQASSDATSAADKKILAVEVESLRGELLGLTNIQDSTGNYVFSGSKMRTAPYQADSSGAVTYQGDSNIMEVNVSDQRRMSVNRPGNDVFTPVLRDSVDLEGGSATYLVNPMAARYSFTPPTGANDALALSDGTTTLSIPVPAAGVTGVAAIYTVPVTNANLGGAAEGDTFTVTVGGATASIPLHPTSADATYAKSTDAAFLSALNTALDGQSIAYTATSSAEGTVILTKDAVGSVSDVPTSKIGATPSTITVTEGTAGVTAVAAISGGVAWADASQIANAITGHASYDSLNYTVRTSGSGASAKIVFDAKAVGPKTSAQQPTFTQATSTNPTVSEVRGGVNAVSENAVRTVVTTTAGVDDDPTPELTRQGVTGRAAVASTPFTPSIDILTSNGAKAALDNLLTALDGINMQRASYGAAINRLEHTMDNLMQMSSNAAATRGRIQDADYAKESTELARTQIVQQASTAMLTQANQSAQSVLALLKG